MKELITISITIFVINMVFDIKPEVAINLKNFMLVAEISIIYTSYRLGKLIVFLSIKFGKFFNQLAIDIDRWTG